MKVYGEIIKVKISFSSKNQLKKYQKVTITISWINLVHQVWVKTKLNQYELQIADDIIYQKENQMKQKNQVRYYNQNYVQLPNFVLFRQKNLIYKKFQNNKKLKKYFSSMSSSPYTPKQIKQYMRKFKIEQTINQSVNDLLRNTPNDPYSYLIGLFQKKCVPDIQILQFSMNQVISGDGFPVISLRIKVNYLNQILKFTLQQPYGISSDQNNLFDAQGKGMKTGISFFNDKIKPILKNKNFRCSQQSQIDSQLAKIYLANQKKGLYQINSISFAVQSIKSRIFSKPLYQIYSQISERQLKNNQVPKIFVNCLHGGKAIGSKCKVFKYYLISNSKQALPLIQPILQNIKKTITSGKGGEAALKYSPDGTFICPLDTILDNLKIVEDSINATPGAKQHFKIGLSWQADTLFDANTKKYQLQNPKTPFDNDQMIDYLLKLLTDKPVISYLQDPLASTQIASWAKLNKKIKETESLKNTKIGVRNGNLLNCLSQNFKQRLNQISVPLTEDSHPDVAVQQRETKNVNKFGLNYLQVRLSQLQTVSNLLRISKLLQKANTQLILQDNAYQTYNTQLVDICFGLGAGCNLGSLVKYDRLSKVYRASQIVRQREQQNA